MLTVRDRGWIARRPREPRWPSFAVSVIATAGLFASAYAAMRSVARSDVGSRDERPTFVALESPVSPRRHTALPRAVMPNPVPVMPRPRADPIVDSAASRTAETPAPAL